MNVVIAAMIAVVVASPAMAYCPSHNPLDLRCSTSDFLNPTFGSVGYYAANPQARFAEIQGCTHPTPYMRENPNWCAAAMQAQRATSGQR